MSMMKKRVDALEQASGVGNPWTSKPTHMIGVRVGRSYQSALEEYRQKDPGQTIEPDHNVIWLQSVAPTYDAKGSIVPPAKDKAPPPSLGELLGDASQ